MLASLKALFNRTVKFLFSRQILFAFIALAAVANGSVSWLRGVGLLDREEYHHIKEQQAYYAGQDKFYTQNPRLITEAKTEQLKLEYINYWSQRMQFLYATPGHLIFVKLLKYILIAVAGLVLFGWWMILGRPIPRNYLFLGLLAIGLLSIVNSLIHYGWWTLPAALYLMHFIIIALFYSAIADEVDLKSTGNWLIASVMLIYAFVPIEYVYGIQYFSTPSPLGRRLVAYMIQPNTLGIFVVFVYALFVSFYKKTLSPVIFALFSVLYAVIIVLSGSMTASLIFILLLGYPFYLNITKQRRSICLNLSVLSGFVIGLFFLGRFRPESMIGRIEKMSYYFSQDLPLFNLLFGQGAGYGSNTLFLMQSYLAPTKQESVVVIHSLDSTLFLMITQLGILGCGLFYGLLIDCIRRDKTLRPGYLVVVLSSLTINIVEVFPINLVLGLMLGLTLSKAKQFRLFSNRE